MIFKSTQRYHSSQALYGRIKSSKTYVLHFKQMHCSKVKCLKTTNSSQCLANMKLKQWHLLENHNVLPKYCQTSSLDEKEVLHKLYRKKTKNVKRKVSLSTKETLLVTYLVAGVTHMDTGNKTATTRSDIVRIMFYSSRFF